MSHSAPSTPGVTTPPTAKCEHKNTRPAAISDQRPFCVTCLTIVSKNGGAQ